MLSGTILVVEDRASLRRMLERALVEEGYRVVTAVDGDQGIERLRDTAFDLVLTDLKLPGSSGMEVLAASRELELPPPVVMLTGFGTVDTAVQAMKLGAIEFLEKPVEIDDLYDLVASVMGVGNERALFELEGGPTIVGRHPRLRAALRMLEKVAPTESTVLLTGDSGTGKELFARAVHALSPRSSAPFVAVNCAALPDSLLENELFGHERGAFTGAGKRQAGRFELAHGGTIFLDEIGELGLGVQAKILRVLEGQGFERVGGGSKVRADVRVVVATNQPLKAMVDEGRFRTDLYFRLEVFPIELPPLRERSSDIPLLSRYLLAKIGERQGSTPPQLSPEALELLEAEPWPGNVRQLANILERASILAEGPRIGVSDLGPLLQGAEPVAGVEADEARDAVRQALLEADGDKREAAKSLGVSYRTLLRRIRRYDLGGFPRYRS